MLVGKISKVNPTQRYDGYADEAATRKKIAFDVIEKGDSVFMTGERCLCLAMILSPTCNWNEKLRSCLSECVCRYSQAYIYTRIGIL